MPEAASNWGGYCPVFLQSMSGVLTEGIARR
jgi:hypothetical protein